MGKSKKRPVASLIKGYLPVRVILPEKAATNEEALDHTFFYVKEHREGNSSASPASKKSESRTLFIANAPVIPGIKTSLLLKNLLGRFCHGDIERVTLVENPRKAAAAPSLAWASNGLQEFFPSCLGGSVARASANNTSSSRNGGSATAEKFAHVVFPTHKQMRKTLQAIQDVMAGAELASNPKQGQLPALPLEKLDLQMLRDESERLARENATDDDDSDGDDDDRMDEAAKPTGIIAVAQRYRKSLHRISRDKLLAECNRVMQDYEDAEQAQQLAREAAANEPDEDGFVTVTSTSVGLEGGKRDLEKDGGGPGGKRRRNANKRSRKKKEGIGATELEDFYRFQRKETRKRTLQDLRLQFEEDLKKVKKMKEDRQYKPF